MAFERALVVFAHPDDAEFGSAGTIATWAREGTEVAYVCVTDGSAGINDPGWTRQRIAEVRKAEQRAACDVLGVQHLTFLDFPDGVLLMTGTGIVPDASFTLQPGDSVEIDGGPLGVLRNTTDRVEVRPLSEPLEAPGPAGPRR